MAVETSVRHAAGEPQRSIGERVLEANRRAPSRALRGLLAALLALGLLAWLTGPIPPRAAPLFVPAVLALSFVAWRLPTLALAAAAWALAAADLAARPLTARVFSYRPHEVQIQRWPRLDLVDRYTPNVRWEGEVTGDLAAMSGSPVREPRHERFATDAFGFRNERVPEAVELVVLGDSYGLGEGTTQERTWASLVERRTGLATYNLSIPGGPWHELVNLQVELDRLHPRPGALVLWTIFPANDLDDPTHEALAADELPWNSLWR